MESMKSSRPSARASRSPPGTESTGLPASVIRARIWPSPGVSISSAIVVAGSIPLSSGRPRTRLRQRPFFARPTRRATLDTSTAGVGNMAPPGRSKLPVTTLSASMSQLPTGPNSLVHTPTRPYATARRAPAKPRPRARIVSAAMPTAGATRSGGKRAASARSASTPRATSCTTEASSSPSAKITWRIARSRAASPPGRMKWCSSA